MIAASLPPYGLPRAKNLLGSRFTTVQIVSQLRAELDRALATPARSSQGPGVGLRVDLFRADDLLVVLAEVPGLTRKDLSIRVDREFVVIRGESVTAGSPAGARFLCVERQWGAFERLLELPASIDPSRSSAKLARGILEIQLPLIEDRRLPIREIEIMSDEEDRS